MPGQSFPLPRRLLYAVDASTGPGSPVTDIRELTSVAAAAVRSGGGHVANSSYVVFPSGAVTLVLILVGSHLVIHVWPEPGRVAIDLFSCGAIAGERILGELSSGLRLERASIRQVDRGSCQEA